MSGEEKARHYRAFIAYSHRDKRWAAWLHRRLEFYRVPRHLVGRETAAGMVPRRLSPIFRDREELASADDLGERIARALEESDALIVVCSPAAARSKWVNEEILRFKRSGRAARIFCLIVDGSPFAAEDSDKVAEECLPPALRYRQDEKGDLGTEAAEPLAADVRPGGDGRTLALLKLAAGLLCLDLDELRRRELQRRNRRWAAVAGIALVVMATTSLLALEATIQRNAAERQRAQAEGLVGFMLGNLLTELQPIGRLDLLDLVGKRSLAYYTAQNPDSLDADSLTRRARALRLIGQVYDLRGNLDAALSVFNQAAATTAKLLSRNPSDPQRIYNHAQSVYWVGYIAWQRGEMDNAEAEFRRYQALAQRLVTINPGNPEWQSELEDSYSNLGTVLLGENKVGEAAEAFRKSLALSVELAQNVPGDTDKQMDLAQSRAWLADAEERLGKIDDAYTQRTMELTVYQKLLSGDPRNSNIRESLVANDLALARLSVARGDLNTALKRLDAAVSVADALIVQDVSNTFWQELDAGTHVELGKVFYYRNDPAAASNATAKAEGLARSLVKRAPSVISWQILLGQTQLLLATLDAHAGDHETALAITQRLVARLATLHPEKYGNKDMQDLLIKTRLLEGDELQALGREGSRAAWEAALAAAGRDSQYRALGTRTAIAGVCLRLEQRERAKSIVAQLDALGYRSPEFLSLKEAISHDVAAQNGPRPPRDP